jgi:hypothetical protein
MNLSSAYPNSDLSALSMTIIAVVMASTLAAWLILVFLADRQPRPRAGARPPRPAAREAVWTEDQLRESTGQRAVASKEPGAYATSDER